MKDVHFVWRAWNAGLKTNDDAIGDGCGRRSREDVEGEEGSESK